MIDSCFPASAEEYPVVDYLAVGQSIDGGTDEQVILFVKLPVGATLSTELEQKIRAQVRPCFAGFVPKLPHLFLSLDTGQAKPPPRPGESELQIRSYRML